MIVNGFGGVGNASDINKIRMVRGVNGDIIMSFTPSSMGALYSMHSIAQECYNSSAAIQVASFTIAAGSTYTFNQTVTNGYYYRYAIYQTITPTIPQEYYGLPFILCWYLDISSTHSSSTTNLFSTSYTGSQIYTGGIGSAYYYVSRYYQYPIYTGVANQGITRPSFGTSGGMQQSMFCADLTANYNPSYLYTYGGLGTYANSYGVANNMTAVDGSIGAPTMNFFSFAYRSASDPGSATLTCIVAFTITMKAIFARVY